MEKTEFIRCPVCGNKTRDKIREDTILKNFPLFCPKCKSECLIDIEQFHITVIKAPDYSGRAKLTFKCREFAATPSRKR